jgi:hypothetical protein
VALCVLVIAALAALPLLLAFWLLSLLSGMNVPLL